MNNEKINRNFLYISPMRSNLDSDKSVHILNGLIEDFNNWQLNLKPKGERLEKLIAKLSYMFTVVRDSNLSENDKSNMFEIIIKMIIFIELHLPNGEKLRFVKPNIFNKTDRKYSFIAPLLYKNGDDKIILYVNEFINRYNQWQLDLKPKGEELEKLIASLYYTATLIIYSKVEDKREIQNVITTAMIFLNNYLPDDEYLTYPKFW